MTHASLICCILFRVISKNLISRGILPAYEQRRLTLKMYLQVGVVN